MAGHEVEVHRSVVPGKEGNAGKVLKIQFPSIDEDAKIWRKAAEYFKIPGVIRKAPGQEGQ